MKHPSHTNQITTSIQILQNQVENKGVERDNAQKHSEALRSRKYEEHKKEGANTGEEIDESEGGWGIQDAAESSKRA